MAVVNDISQAELGRYLSRLREETGIKQAELAMRLTWSPAVLSRVESGERAISAEEFDAMLVEIGSSEAQLFRERVRREWVVLPRPALDHPDQEALWVAERTAQAIEARRSDPKTRISFARRLSAVATEIRRAADLLAKREHHVAFIGSIGIGKSTAICRLLGLEIADSDGGPVSPVLGDGAGGPTLCEVHLRQGATHGVRIDPCSDGEIRDYVADFAEYLRGVDALDDDKEDAESDHRGVSREVERAIRNMADLRVHRVRGADGKRTARDEAKTLASSCSTVRELVLEILSRMELHRRDRRDAWYDASSGKPPLAWMKDLLSQVNNGRHPEFSLPKRVEVVVPEAILGLTEITIRIVETKGIDRTSARADLERHLDDPHTLALLCCGFNDAPSQPMQLLLERAFSADIHELTDRAALVVFPRTGEALAAKDESGNRAESLEEGYELKGEEVEAALEALGFATLKAGFFNSRQDAPERLRAFVIDCVDANRRLLGERLNVVTHSAQSILRSEERDAAQESIKAASGALRRLITQLHLVRPGELYAKDSLLEALDGACASTVRASIKRNGEWCDLSYAHQLGHGARRVAVAVLHKIVNHFVTHCAACASMEEFRAARDLTDQAARTLASAYEELLRKAQLMGENSYANAVTADAAFWTALKSESSGKGYKARIVAQNLEWFGQDESETLEAELWTLIEREWKNAVSAVCSLLDAEGS